MIHSFIFIILSVVHIKDKFNILFQVYKLKSIKVPYISIVYSPELLICNSNNHIEKFNNKRKTKIM